MTTTRTPLAPLAILALLAGCGGENTPSAVDAPGREPTAKTRMLGAGAAMLQDKTPVDAIHAYVCGFHFYSGDLTRQVEAHHYCSHVNDDLLQCVIYDGNGEDAKLIGIEYIISAALFESLPDDERPYWHSHHHEVKSGQLIAPGLPEAAEHELMEELVSTYGKTIHTWQVDRGDPLPLGPPSLMMGFTADGQARPELVADRDGRFDVSTAENRERRADIPMPEVLPGANAWERGTVITIEAAVGSGTEGYDAPADAVE